MKLNIKPAVSGLVMAVCLFPLSACGKTHTVSEEIHAGARLQMEQLPGFLEKSVFNNTLMGMGTVLGVLIFISLLIGGFRYMGKFKDKMKGKAQENASRPIQEAPAPAAPQEEGELVDDLELAAVITAAIAASTGSSSQGLVVRSIKRAPAGNWKKA